MQTLNTAAKRPRSIVSESAKATGPITMGSDKRPPVKPAATSKKTTKKKSKAPTTTVVAVRRPKLIWRTRDQENSTLYNLQLDVAGLQSEIQGLQAYRNLLMGRVLNRQDDLDGSFMRTVREYFQVFEHGYVSNPQWSRPRRHAQPAITHEPTMVSPDEFLRRVMDEHVAIGRFSGLSQIVKQWELYSSVFGPMTLSFVDAQILPSVRELQGSDDQVLITARAQYHLYISLRTLEIMFPHVLPHQEIVTHLLGRRISGIGKFDFIFDVQHSRIMRYEFELDLTGSFIDLLGDPALVAFILDGALISDEFFIGDLSDLQPEAESSASESEETNQEDHGDTQETRPWKLTISSILSPEDDSDASDALSMDEVESTPNPTLQDDTTFARRRGVHVRLHQS